ELLRSPSPLPAQPRLQTARRIVDPGMNDPTVMPGLMDSQRLGLLHQHHTRPRRPPQNPIRGSHPDNPAPDHTEVVHAIQLLSGVVDMSCTIGAWSTVRAMGR